MGFVYEVLAGPLGLLFCYCSYRLGEASSLFKRYLLLYAGVILLLTGTVDEYDIIQMAVVMLLLLLPIVSVWLVSGLVYSHAQTTVGSVICSGISGPVLMVGFFYWQEILFSESYYVLIAVGMSCFIFAAALHTEKTTKNEMAKWISICCCVVLVLMVVFYERPYTVWRALYGYGRPIFLILFPMILDEIYERLRKCCGNRKNSDIAVAISYFSITIFLYTLITCIYVYLDITSSPGVWFCFTFMSILVYKLKTKNQKYPIWKYLILIGSMTVSSLISGIMLFFNNPRIREVFFHMGMKPYGISLISRADYLRYRLSSVAYFFGYREFYDQVTQERFSGVFDAWGFWGDGATALWVSRVFLIVTILVVVRVIRLLLRTPMTDLRLRRWRDALIVSYLVRLCWHTVMIITMVSGYYDSATNTFVRYIVLDFIILRIFLQNCRCKVNELDEETDERYDVFDDESDVEIDDESDDEPDGPEGFKSTTTLVCIMVAGMLICTGMFGEMAFQNVRDRWETKRDRYIEETRIAVEPEETEMDDYTKTMEHLKKIARESLNLTDPGEIVEQFCDLEIRKKKEDNDTVICEFVRNDKVISSCIIYGKIQQQWVFEEEDYVLYVIEGYEGISIVSANLREREQCDRKLIGFSSSREVSIKDAEIIGDGLWFNISVDDLEAIYYVDIHNRKRVYTQLVLGYPVLADELIPEFVKKFEYEE